MTPTTLTRPATLGLPGHYYTDAAIFAQELNTLWRSTWQFVGRVEDLQRPGDYLTSILGAEPILVIRVTDGSLRAMHNVCPHRGARLLDGQGNCGLLRCPYHSWTYDLEGNLLGVPQQNLFPGLDKTAIHLLAARVETWGGFVFVNPDPDGESLSSYLAGFPDYLLAYSHAYEDLREVDRWSYEEAINWKLIVENYVEDYHFTTAHAESLKFFDFKGIRSLPTGRHTQIYVPYADPELDEAGQRRSKPEPMSYQGYIFPNLMVNTAGDHVSVFRVLPLDALRTRTEVIMYQTPAQMETTPLDLAELRANFNRVMEEDFAVCRLLQAGVGSRAYQVTQLAEERELGIAHFHQVLSEYLGTP